MANSLSAIDWDGKFRSDSWNSEIHIWWDSDFSCGQLFRSFQKEIFNIISPASTSVGKDCMPDQSGTYLGERDCFTSTAASRSAHMRRACPMWQCESDFIKCNVHAGLCSQLARERAHDRTTRGPPQHPVLPRPKRSETSTYSSVITASMLPRALRPPSSTRSGRTPRA